MLILRQSTAIDIRMGPFVDAADGVAPETGITLGAADQAEVLKENGAATVAMAGTFAAVTGADGWYDYTVAAGDVDTVGEVVFVVQDASVCLPVFVRGYVVEESIYDSLYDAGSSDIADILVDTGATLDGKLDDIQGATFDTGTDSLEALRLRGDAAWTGSALTSESGTAQAGSSTTITLASGATADDNVLEGHLIYIHTGTGAGQAKAIAENGYDGGTKVATIVGTWEINPNATSQYDIYPDAITEYVAAPTASVVADAVWDENTTGHTDAGTFGEQAKVDVDSILTKATSLDSAWADAGRLDTILDSILEDTNELQADWVDAGRLDAILDLILADTGELQTDWTNDGRLDAILDARASQASITALENVSVADILTTQMTESYAADGAAPTMTQALMLIQQALTEFAITGTVLSIKEVDGVTEAATGTLNSASAPTSITRAT